MDCITHTGKGTLAENPPAPRRQRDPRITPDACRRRRKLRTRAACQAARHSVPAWKLSGHQAKAAGMVTQVAENVKEGADQSLAPRISPQGKLAAIRTKVRGLLLAPGSAEWGDVLGEGRRLSPVPRRVSDAHLPIN